MLAGRPATQQTSHCQPRPNLAVCADRAYRQPTNMQPPFVIAVSSGKLLSVP